MDKVHNESFKTHLNNQKCNHKGLCKKNEYCKSSFIVNESTVFWIGHNAHEINHVIYLLTMWLQFQKSLLQKLYLVIFQNCFKI